MDTDQQLVDRQVLTDQASGADRDLRRRIVEHYTDFLGGAMRVLKAKCARAGIRVAGVQHHRDDLAALDDLLRPQHRRSLDAVAGEDAGCVTQRSVIDDKRDIAAAARLDTGHHAGCPKPLAAVTLTA